MKGPTERTLKKLRADGYTADVVERWIPQARRRKDLFGFIDVLALKDGETLAVQTTSASNMSSRVKKIEDADAVGDVRDAGWRIVVHGWRKNAKGRWVCNELDLS